MICLPCNYGVQLDALSPVYRTLAKYDKAISKQFRAKIGRALFLVVCTLGGSRAQENADYGQYNCDLVGIVERACAHADADAGR